MNKKYLHILFTAIIIMIGVIMALSASSFASIPSQAISAATPTITTTPTTTHGGVSQAGSTDWIALMGVIIVLIVIIPVIFRRSTWMK